MTPTDSRAEQPESKPTLALKKDEIISAQLKHVIDLLGQHRVETSESFRAHGANIELVVTEVGVIKDRIIVLESWKNDQDVRASRNSARAKQASETDLTQQAQIADVLVWRAKVDDKLGKTATKEDLKLTTAAQTKALLDELKKNPVVQKIIFAVGGAIAAYLASKGVHL